MADKNKELESDSDPGNSDTATNMATLQAIKGYLTVSKGQHTRSGNNLRKILTVDPFPINKLTFVQDEFRKFGKAYDEIVEHYKELLAYGGSDANIDSYFDTHDEISELYHTNVPQPDSTSKKSSDKSSKSDKLPTPKLRIPDMKPFNNTVRKYPSFKTNFRTNYEKFYGDHAAMVLRENLLTGFSKEICESSNTVDEIFNELDIEYGDHGQIIEAVMADINNIPKCSSENLEELIRIRKTLKTAQVDLEHVNLDNHVKHFQTVLSVTSKLPSKVKRRWAETVAKSKIPVEKRFEELLVFLALEIRTLELLQENDQNPDDSKKDEKKEGQSKHGFGAQGQPGFSGDSKPGRLPKCLLHPESSNHFLSRCKKLKTMKTDEQLKFLQGDGKEMCRSCLRKHEGPCAISIVCSRDGCSKNHFNFLHETCDKIRGKKPGASYFGQGQVKVEESGQGQVTSQGHTKRLDNVKSKQTTPTTAHVSAISPAQYVHVNTTSGPADIKMLWDQGSNITLTTKRLAERYQFETIKENPTNLSIEIVGASKIEQPAARCKIQLLNEDDEPVETVIAYVVHRIGTLQKVNLEEAVKVFGIQEEFKYPDGELDLLLGTDNFHLVLQSIAEVDGLRLDESILGKVIYGRHPSFDVEKKANKVLVKAKVSTPTSKTSKTDSRMDDQVKSLFATESMGISCTPSCGRCGCGKCTLDGSGWSLQERFEYQQIRESMTIQNKVIMASYPYKRNPEELPDNRNYAMKRLQSLERDLKKDAKLATAFTEQFQDMITRGKMRTANPEELAEWKGAVNHLPMNYVLKDSSASTPLRIVFDGSAKIRGICVNDVWGRGPNLVREALGILVRFCENRVTMFADIRKMYQTVMTTPKEWHLHRILWRNLEDREPDTYLIICNSFGDGPAGTVAIAAIHLLAEKVQDKLPAAAKTLLENVYVDDILESCQTREEAEKLAKEIDETLAAGSFSVKKWTFVDSGNLAPNNSNPLAIGGDAESVLGMNYDTATDQFRYSTQLNFGKKKRGAKTTPNLQKDEIHDTSKVPVLTKRNILSQVHTIYDPMGKVQPFLTELKFLLGKLYRYRDENDRPLDWDEPVPQDFDKLWRETLNLFFDIEQLKFPRCLSPLDPAGNPILVTFADSSMIAFGACMYLWWKLDNGRYFTRLIMSKSRMWPIEPDDYLSVCRGELQAAVTGKKLAEDYINSSRFSIEEKLFVIDSEIVHAQISMDSHNFSIFVGHRVAEIRAIFPTDLWWLTKSEHNACADLLSRGTRKLSELDDNSEWQTGPKWLQGERDSWPLSQTRTTNLPIPELRAADLSRRTMMVTSQSSYNHEPELISGDAYYDSRIVMMIQTLGEGDTDAKRILQDIPQTFTFSSKQYDVIESLVDLTRHDNLHRWLGTTYRVLVALSWEQGDGCFFKHLITQPVISSPQRQIALQFWLKQAQKSLIPRIKSGQFKTLTPFLDQEGIRRCNKRASQTTDPYCPILLPTNHPISRLIVIQYHRRGHTGATTTAAKVRAEYHILKLRQLAMSVRNKCHLCRLVEKRLMKAPMGSLPVTRLMPSFPFEHCSCDLFGPFNVKLHIKTTRNRKPDPVYTKAVGLLITCLSTRAIHLEIMHGQTTDAFLQAFRRFSCLRGHPKSMHSDRGSQLVAADANLQTMVDDFDMEKIKEYGALNSMIWTYSSAGSPWQNGVTESMVSSVKKTLRTVLDGSDLSILELQTIFYEVAQILNERPINLGGQGASGNDIEADSNSYICPNQLLLGRSTSVIPQNFESIHCSPDKRLLINQEIVSKWWTTWTDVYLPTLIKQSKWFQFTRPAKVGDIVYIKDLNPIRGQWNIGEIIDIRENQEQVPRDVFIRYRKAGGSGSKRQERTCWRDVKNLCLIVGADERSELNPRAPEFSPRG